MLNRGSKKLNETRLRYSGLSNCVARGLASIFVMVAALNALYFVLRVSNPVIQADAWYFLDVFLRKAINGSLGLADFFVKRSADDHAQPLFKLLRLLNWRYLDLDFVVDAVVGVFAAVATALIYARMMVSAQTNGKSEGLRYLAWAVICALLFSLNSTGIWIWPLVALENVTFLIVLLFFIATWHAYRSQRYVTLVVATLILGISSDDSAVIAVIAVGLALLCAQLADPVPRRRSIWITFAIIALCMVLVRVGYAFQSVPYGSSFASVSRLLFERLRDGGWWQWIFLPLVLPVYFENPLGPLHAGAWLAAQVIMAILLFAAHILFWRRAFYCKYNLAVFTAVGTMLLTYGWVAGIIIWRVSLLGNGYLGQPRYVLIYAGHLTALILMWACSKDLRQQPTIYRQITNTWFPVAGCIFILAIQVPQSIAAWHMRKYVVAYYAATANQIDRLTRDPANGADCALAQPACGMPPKVRANLTQLLSEHRLNIYSPRVQSWHKYLPALLPVSRGAIAPEPVIEAATGKKP